MALAHMRKSEAVPIDIAPFCIDSSDRLVYPEEKSEARLFCD